MAHDYKAIQWTPFKKAYDVAMAFGVAAFLITFAIASALTFPAEEQFAPIQLMIRALGFCAFALLTLVLCIGPLARLSPRFLPLLYNRRHMGVTCFLLALVHAGLTLLWYHGFSDMNPLVSLLAANPRYTALQGFPFESLGAVALLILFVMAATSHDFWNANLGPVTWKSIHMSVYGAYALLVGHVMLGAVQQERSIVYPLAVATGALLVVTLHLFAAGRARRADRTVAPESEGWLRVAAVADIAEARARIVMPAHGEAIAVFRSKGRIFALSNVCRHQGGPLGEGKVIDDCVTCPWHGFQYRADGKSPPPYNEEVAVYQTRIVDGVVYVHGEPSTGGAAPTPIPA